MKLYYFDEAEKKSLISDIDLSEINKKDCIIVDVYRYYNTASVCVYIQGEVRQGCDGMIFHPYVYELNEWCDILRISHQKLMKYLRDLREEVAKTADSVKMNVAVYH